MTIVLDKPSALIHEIRLEQVGEWNLFKFSDALQDRMEGLLERKKEVALTAQEESELEAIGELDRIFTQINAMVAMKYGDQ